MNTRRYNGSYGMEAYLNMLLDKWETINEEADRHREEHGKDQAFYALRGQSYGILESIEMAEDMIAARAGMTA